MVKVVVEDKCITIKGHASAGEFGRDIVCASVSSIAITTVNAMLRFNDKSIDVVSNDGFMQIKILESSNETLVLLENMISLLVELEKQYKKNISVKMK